MEVFDHLHESGRFTVSPEVLGDWLDKERPDSDLITYTEIDDNRRAKELEAQGWGTIFGDKGPRDDCGISWRKTKFEKIFADTITLDSPSYKNKRGWMTDKPEAAFAVLLTRDGKILVVGVAHMPTSVGGNKVYNKTLQSLFFNAQQLAKTHHADSTMLVCDWNKNLRLAFVRHLFSVFLKGYKVTWKFPLPKRGTFNNSVIDYTMGKNIQVVKPPQLLKHTKASDHTAYRERLSLK